MHACIIQSAENDPERLSQLLVEITNRSEEIQAVGISIATTLIEALTNDAIENEEVMIDMNECNAFIVGNIDKRKLFDYH